MDINRSIGNNIRSRREAKHLTREELARKVGFTVIQLEGFEEAHTDITILELHALALALDCFMADLLEDQTP